MEAVKRNSNLLKREKKSKFKETLRLCENIPRNDLPTSRHVNLEPNQVARYFKLD